MNIKETITVAILRILQTQTEFTADLFDTFLRTRADSYKKVRRRLLHGERTVEPTADWGDLYLERERFYKTLSKLQHAGLVRKTTQNAGSLWSITKRGSKKVHERYLQQVVVAQTKFPTIVSYDVPESHKKDRAWLRSTLRGFGFTMAQRSVWVARVALPKEFIEELRERKLLKYVHVIEESAHNTLELK